MDITITPFVLIICIACMDDLKNSCFSARHTALRRRKNKDWLAQNQDNASEWGDISTRRLLFQWASTIKIQLSVLLV